MNLTIPSQREADSFEALFFRNSCISLSLDYITAIDIAFYIAI